MERAEFSRGLYGDADHALLGYQKAYHILGNDICQSLFFQQHPHNPLKHSPNPHQVPWNILNIRLVGYNNVLLT